MFALSMIALGTLQYFTKEYIIGRPPAAEWAANIDGKLTWAYVSGALLIAAGIAIILKIRPAVAAIFISLLILIPSFFLRHLPEMTKAKKIEDLLWYINAYKTLALAGGALIVGASFLSEKGRNRTGAFSNSNLTGIGIFLLALFLIICGMSHFKFVDFIANGFILDYIPARTFWTYFTGVALLAGGLGLLIRPVRKWAALLSGIMILLWFFMLHIPRAINNPNDYGEWMGVFESFGFAGILFVVSSYAAKSKI